MSVREVAEYLNVSASWVYRNASRSGLVPYRFGGGGNAKIRFKVSEVDAWVKQQRAPKGIPSLGNDSTCR
ncbi:helix-turn-helix domain-containing protein [Streptomyces capillispiralis]